MENKGELEMKMGSWEKRNEVYNFWFSTTSI